MNWLEEHITGYALPQLWRALGRNGDAPMNLTPARKCFCPEAGLLKAAWTSWSSRYHAMDPTPNVKFGKFKFSLLTTEVDYSGGHSFTMVGKGPIEDQVHSILKSSVKSLRAQTRGTDKLVHFWGRDVWPWYVMSRRLGMGNTRFIPHMSRAVVRGITISRRRELAEMLYASGLKPYDLLFDTGFVGSIPGAVQDLLRIPLDYTLFSGSNIQWPNFRANRNFALAFEYLPKYWKTGRWDGDTLRQDPASALQVLDTALLTCWIWHHQSPSIISWKGAKMDTS